MTSRAVAPAPGEAPAADEADVEAGPSIKDKVKEKAAEGAAKARAKGASWLEGQEGGEGIAEHFGGADTAVLRALIPIVILEYGAWFGASAVLYIVFGIGVEDFVMEIGMSPFDHVNFTPLVEGGEWRPLVHWLATVFTVTLAAPWLVYFFVRPNKVATEAGTAMQALHFFLATTVTQQTPENWIWWATVMPCFIFMGRVAEFLVARLPPRERKKRTGSSTMPHNKWG